MDNKAQTKAMPSWVLVVSLLGLVLLIVILVFQYNLFEVTESAAIDSACKTSVTLHSSFKLAGKDFFSKIKCPTRYVKVSKEKDVLPTMANELYNCWNNFGQDQLELFQHTPGEKRLYCVICSNVEFQGMNFKQPGLLNYLLKTNIPRQKKTFFEFLSNVEFSEFTEKPVQNLINVHDSNNEGLIDLSKSQSVIFVYNKTSERSKFETTFWGATRAGALGLGSTTAYLASIGGISLLGFTVLPTLAVGTVGTVTAASLGGYTGYLFGAEQSAKWKAGVLTLPYSEENINKLGCDELPIGGEGVEIII